MSPDTLVLVFWLAVLVFLFGVSQGVRLSNRVQGRRPLPRWWRL